MDLDQIKRCIDAMAASDLAEMEFSEGGWTLRLVRRAQIANSSAVPSQSSEAPPCNRIRSIPPAAKIAAEKKKTDTVVAPLFGIVYLRPGPNAENFISPGQSVTPGTPLCVIEAMKMFHEIRADREGTIAAILVTSGQEVDAGQELMRFA